VHGQVPSVTPQAPQSQLMEAIRECRQAFAAIGLFSFFINILMLTGALFMLQIYDRVLPKGFRNSSFFRWWKGCHVEHHRGAPTGNYCVTFPALDFVLGSYVPPREQTDPVVKGSEVAS